MSLSRRAFLKSSAAIAVASGGLKLFGLNEVFASDTVLIPHASHYGPFKAVVKNGVLIGVQPLPGFDPMPTQMLLEGVLSRTYHPTRVQYPMVRRSYLANPRGRLPGVKMIFAGLPSAQDRANLIAYLAAPQ